MMKDSDPQSAAARETGQPKLQLPPAPPEETGAVKAWEQPVTMRSYMPAAPDPNPLFLEKRVYQGSSGRVYPLPVVDRIDTEPHDHAWREYLQDNPIIMSGVWPSARVFGSSGGEEFLSKTVWSDCNATVVVCRITTHVDTVRALRPLRSSLYKRAGKRSEQV